MSYPARLAGRPPGGNNSRVRMVAPKPGTPRWRTRAACQDEDPELWFSYDPGEQREAEQICNHHCPVQRECRAEAILLGHDWGIWGGIEEKRRRAIRKKLASDQHIVGILE